MPSKNLNLINLYCHNLIYDNIQEVTSKFLNLINIFAVFKAVNLAKIFEFIKITALLK